MANNNYLKSFKVPSRIVTLATTLIIALLTYVAAMQPETLAAYLPGYEGYAAIIIVIAAALVNQYSEEKSRASRRNRYIKICNSIRISN